MARRETDPLASFNFALESQGLIHAGFSECTGLNSETNIVEYREGNDAPHVRKLFGLTKYGNVTLKRGVGLAHLMFEWRKMVTDIDFSDPKKDPRRSLSIILYDEQRKEQVRYNLTNAWPSKWTGPDFKASANEIAIEQLELTHEGVTVG